MGSGEDGSSGFYWILCFWFVPQGGCGRGSGDDLGRRPYRGGIVGDGLVDHAASADDRVFADDQAFFLTGNQRAVHAYISAFFDMDGIVPLIPAVAGKEHSVGNDYIVLDFNEIGAHVIEVAAHANEDVLPDFISTPAVEYDPEAGERDGWDEYGREPLSDGLGENRPQRIVVIVRRFFSGMPLAVEPAQESLFGFLVFHRCKIGIQI